MHYAEKLARYIHIIAFEMYRYNLWINKITNVNLKVKFCSKIVKDYWSRNCSPKNFILVCIHYYLNSFKLDPSWNMHAVFNPSVQYQYYCDIFIHMLFMNHDVYYYYVHDHAKTLFFTFLLKLYHECENKLRSNMSHVENWEWRLNSFISRNT